MLISKPTIIFLFILLLTYTNTASSDHCFTTQVCSPSDPTTRYVRFPFLLRNDSLSKSCGYPGFDLFCNGADKLSVYLPNSGVFSVQAIDYVKQELWLNDPNNCLPKRLLSLNLSNSGDSTFVAAQEQVYRLYNCSNDHLKSFSDMKPIRCLSGTRNSVVATRNDTISKTTQLSLMCDQIGLIRVPVGSMSKKMNYSDLSGDIRLRWVKPECGECFQRGGQCGFKSNSSLDVGCFNLTRRGLPRSALVAIGLAIATPIVMFFACVACITLRSIYSQRRTGNIAEIELPRTTTTTTTTPQPPETTIIRVVDRPPLAILRGLDRSIIETYPKVVLGESMHLPNPEDKSCSICLGDYLPNEILRIIPHCDHCFHVDCVDEWLQLNGSCPICRISPSQSVENSGRG